MTDLILSQSTPKWYLMILQNCTPFPLNRIFSLKTLSWSFQDLLHLTPKKMLYNTLIPFYQAFLHPSFPWGPQQADTCAAWRGSPRFSEADASLAAPWKLNALLKRDSGSIWRSVGHKKRREDFIGMFHTSEFPLFPEPPLSFMEFMPSVPSLSLLPTTWNYA